MSNHRDSLVKVLEYLVNEEREKAADLLHDVFVEKAKNHWAALSENDESVEEDIQEEDLDETYDVEVEEAIDSYDAEEDFLDDIESAEDEIDAEEVFGEDEHEDDAEMDLEVSMDDEGEGEEEAPEAEEAMANVEDAIAELRAAFADLMGDNEPGDEESDMEPEMEEDYAFESEEDDDEVEAVEEAADLKSVSVSMPNGEDSGAKSPVKDAGNKHEGKPHPTDTKVENGGKAPAAKNMGVRGPQEAGKSTLSAAPAPKREMK